MTRTSIRHGAARRVPARCWERARWTIATQVNRLPHQCWAGLVSWALHGARFSHRFHGNALPWRPISDSCRRDAAADGGCCACLKVHPPVPPAIWLATQEGADT